MIRRSILLMAGALVGAGTVAAEAQQAGRIYRIGRLSPLSVAADTPFVSELRQGLLDLGWREGRDFVFVSVFADGRLDRLGGLAAELVRLKVDLIVTGSNPGALAAMSATDTIPIVMVTTGDPVLGGIVPSLARPGRNLTGVTALGEELNVKRLELLKQTFPEITRVGVLTNRDSPYTQQFLPASARAAPVLGVQLHVLEAHDAGELEAVFATMRSVGAEALLVLPDIVFITHRARIAELAARHRLPAMYGEREFVTVGGLMFYGASLPGMYRRAGSYVDKIFKGAKPGDLPIEQPTKFELVINLKTARTLGLDIPSSILARADEVIE